jgi:23S rRNA pseudouridine2605 synthase
MKMKKPEKKSRPTERPEKQGYQKRRREEPARPERSTSKPGFKRQDPETAKPVYRKRVSEKAEHPRRNMLLSRPKEELSDSSEPKKDSGLIRLNKYIADAGICSRREADNLILAGAVRINGEVVTALGTKVAKTDRVQFGDQTLAREKLRYLLLNKPKGFITSTEDPHHEKTVMNLVHQACKERIYPVGRLDRNTTGLLLFTNDGQLTKKISHPRYGIKKIYHAVLDKALTKTDMVKIAEGIELDDGKIKVDAIEYVGDGADKKELGVELHSGKNRIVRRIFEKLGYNVVKLDRVYFAGLTKKNLPRGHWRFLEEKEINMLKMLS